MEMLRTSNKENINDIAFWQDVKMSAIWQYNSTDYIQDYLETTINNREYYVGNITDITYDE